MSHKIKILIAEDMELLRANLVEMLEQEDDFKIVGQCGTGKEIVALSEKIPADIILMDIDMEEKGSGISAAQEIAKFNSKVKIIFLTVHEDDSSIIEAMGTGAVDYITKTVDCKNIIDHIRKALKDKVELEKAVQKILNQEFVRLKKHKMDNLEFVKKVMLLTQTEREIIGLLLEEKKVSEIADIRFVELVTIKKQIGALLKKFQARRTKEIVAMVKDLEIQSIFQDE